jgi:hypothetical protein
LLIVSDHGFDKYSYGIDLNEYLTQQGLVFWREDRTIDLDRSLVIHNMWHLYFNDDLMTHDVLRANGVDIADGEEPRVAFARHLQGLAEAFQGANGEDLPLELAQLARSDSDVPDMAVGGSYGEYIVDFWNIRDPKGRVVRRLDGSEEWRHIRDGILLAWGDNVRGGDAGVADIQDVAPTMAYLLGLPVSRDIDGTLLTDLFTRKFVARQPVGLIPDYSDVEKTPFAGAADREALEKKLRSLGYIR